MNPTLGRIRRSTIFLAIVLAIAVCGYKIFGRSWIDSAYMVSSRLTPPMISNLPSTIRSSSWASPKIFSDSAPKIDFNN